MTKRIIALALVVVSLLGVRAAQAQQVVLIRVVPIGDLPLDSDWNSGATIIVIATDGVLPLTIGSLGCPTLGVQTFQGVETIVLFAGEGALRVTMYVYSPLTEEPLSRGDRMKQITNDDLDCCVDASFNQIGCTIEGATEAVKIVTGSLQQPASAGAALFTSPVALDVDALGVVTGQTNDDGTHTVIFKKQGSPAQQVDIASFDELFAADVLRGLIDLGQDPDTGEYLYLAFIEW